MADIWPPVNGLSPHTRGKPHSPEGERFRCRPIPAYAGETRPPASPRSGGKAYPRIRGGNFSVVIKIGLARGLSPHTRGKP